MVISTDLLNKNLILIITRAPLEPAQNGFGTSSKEKGWEPPDVDLYSGNVPIRPLARTPEIFQFTRFSSVPRVRQYLKLATFSNFYSLHVLSFDATKAQHTDSTN